MKRHIFFLLSFIFLIGFLVHSYLSYLEETQAKQDEYQRQIRACERRIKEIERRFILINSDDCHWEKMWEDYMWEQMIVDDF